MSSNARRLVFLLTCVAAIALPLAYVWSSSRSSRPSAPRHSYLPLHTIEPERKGVLFRSTVPDESFGRLVLAGLDPDATWELSDLKCDRAYFQHGRGVCQVLNATFAPPYAVSVFDADLESTVARPLSGVPNRARVSPDGRRAAITVFEVGHSYAEGGFSTRTTILDAASGQTLGDLEQFVVTRSGVPFKAVDFNFWGVTFADDGNRFYATLRTGGVNYLIEGLVDAKTARVVHAGVECPSLSPDGRRLAFKKRFSDPMTVYWKVAVLELDSMRETVLETEQRSVDDQVDWLDDDHVVYHLPKTNGADVWVLAINGQEAPRLLIEGAYSPSVLR